MPVFNGNLVPPMTDLYVGESYNLFVNEALTAPATSVVISPSGGPVGRKLVNFATPSAAIIDNSGFQFYWAVLISSTSLQVLGSNTVPTSAGPQNGQQIPGSPLTVPAGNQTLTVFIT